MWSLFFLCCLTVPGCNSKPTSIHLDPNNTDLYIAGEYKQARDYIQGLTGCPDKIPIIVGGIILAGRFYKGKGHDVPQLACNGELIENIAEKKVTFTSSFLPMGSIIINPGCTFIAFREHNWGGEFKEYNGPDTIPNVQIGGPFWDCLPDHIPCVASWLWTCKQVYPSCVPTDKWQTITELDNSNSSVPTKFTYEKMVGTEFSQEMKESQFIDQSVTASISTEFYGITASMSVSQTTGYDWSQTDSETQSEAKTYNVEIVVPAGTKLKIQEVLGICGGNKLHTQMFKVLDSNTKKTLKSYHGKVANITTL